MLDNERPFRSVLYIPASNERALDKALSLPADAIIFDLEDAVAPGEKTAARDILHRALQKGDYGPRYRIVRVNGLDTPWGVEDVRAIGEMMPDAVLIPKVNGPREIDRVLALGAGVPIWAMMETAAGILNAASIAAHEGLAGMVMGTNDLAKELGCRDRADRLPLQTSLQTTLLAAKAHGRVCVDGVFNAFRDDEGLRVECEQGRDLGFDGKTLIHPLQLATANAVFAPDAASLDMARRQIEAFDKAEAQGQGVAVLDGKIVENLHVETARSLLAKADAIAARDASLQG